MSLRLIVAGYAFCICASILGCIAIIRSGHGSRRLYWLIAGLASTLWGILLFAGSGILPVFFSVILANEAIFAAFILFHQAVAAILGPSRRYVSLSFGLAGLLFLAFLYYTYTVPDLRARILVRTVAISIQSTATVVILLRHRTRPLRHARLVVCCTIGAFLLLQLARIIATLIWTPTFSHLELDSVQASFSSFGFILGLGEVLAITWLGMSAQRDKLHLMATTDGLSGLMNRRTFDQVLARELEDAERRCQPVALLMIDIDRFKEINDNFGHPAGDEVIRRVSHLLCVNTRTMDAVARYGGEEFTMVLRNMNLLQAQSIAERLRTQIEAMAGLPEALRVTASIGIAVADEGETAASLIRRSDAALYNSKRTGRNRVSCQYVFAES